MLKRIGEKRYRHSGDEGWPREASQMNPEPSV